MQVSLQLLLLLAAGYAFQSCPSICTCKWKNGKLDNIMWTKFHKKFPYIVRNTEGMVFSHLPIAYVRQLFRSCPCVDCTVQKCMKSLERIKSHLAELILIHCRAFIVSDSMVRQ